MSGKIVVLGVDSNLRVFDYAGTVLDSFTVPYYGYMKVTTGEDIFITYAHEVLRFSNTGAVVGRFGMQGEEIAQFNYARQIVVDGSTLYVIDERNYRVQGFELSGNFVLRFGTTGFDTDSTGSYPGGIAVARNGRILVGTDTHVLVFQRR